MEVLHQFTTSLTSPTAPVVHAMQYDLVRQIRMRIYSGATVWPVPEGVVAGVSYTLPNREKGYFERLSDGTAACTIDGNEVTALVAPVLTSVAGVVAAAVVLRKGDEEISTFPFQLRVTARPGAATKPEAQPDAVSAFAGKLFYGSHSGTTVPLGVGTGLEVQDGKLRALADPDAVSKEYVDEVIAELRADINYKPISITDISIRPNVAQLGQTVTDAEVSWTLSKEPVAQTVDGTAVGPGDREYTVAGAYSKAVTVTVTDERDAVDSRSVGISFYNAVYYTDQWPGGVPTDADLWAMPQKLQSGRGLTISAASGDGEYVLYACPKRMGTPEFWANGFQGGFRPMGIRNHINPQGYREEYSIYISEAAGLTATITVK